MNMKSSPGTTLLEMVIALGLMGLLLLMVVELIIKGNATSTALSGRHEEAPEIQALISVIQADLNQGAYISSNSHDQRLEYTTYDPATGTATKKIYVISGGNLILYTSVNNGTLSAATTPYLLAPSSKYKVTGKFLYSWPINNCTNFTDTDGNGVWKTGEGSAYSTCPNGSSTPLLTNPSQATKVDLQNFVFSTGKSGPNGIVQRVLPPDIFISTGTDYVRSTMSAALPAVSDPQLLQSFVTNTANSLYGTTFDIRGLYWDNSRDRLLLVGNNNDIFMADRDGVIIGPTVGLALSNTATKLTSIALESDYKTVLALDTTAKNLYSFSLVGTPPLLPMTTSSISTLTTPKSIAYDASTPNDFYVVDGTGSTWKVEERNIVTPTTLDGGPWALPAAFTTAAPPTGMAIEPDSGDFLIVQNSVVGTSPNQTITIYRIARAAETVFGTAYASGATVATYVINTSNLHSTATGTNGNWGLAYDPDLNRFFLSDDNTHLVYEVIPPALVSQRK